MESNSKYILPNCLEPNGMFDTKHSENGKHNQVPVD